MSRKQRSWRSKTAMAAGVAAVAGALMFGSFGEEGGPIGTGERRVTAQASGSLAGTSGTLQPIMSGADDQGGGAPQAPTAAQIRAMEAQMERAAAGMAARAAGLPASDPRVQSAAPPPAASTQSVSRVLAQNSGVPGPLADGDAAIFANSTLNPAGAGLPSSSVNEPSVAQSGQNVFMTWNWGAATSVNGGGAWAYFNPAAVNGMADFCCDQDVIYDKGRDRFFWLRQGLSGAFASPLGGTENRDMINVFAGAANQCFYDIRPSITGNPAFANTWFDYPRIALSNNHLYVGTNVFSNAGAFVTHFLIRFALTPMAGCGSVPFSWWSFTDGWTPALIENAGSIMYIGDQIVTNTGLNDQFRIAWLYDDSTTLNFVNRTIAPYLFTNRFGAHCPVPGGVDPCQRADQRVTGAVLQNNSPTPQGLGIAGDRIDFYWNVREGNGFPLPYVESATFQGNTITYTHRKLIWNGGVTFFYAAAGANDRNHVGISLYQFNPVASGANPYHLIGIDDDFNGNPPGWELYVANASTALWNASSSGDYLRARQHSPAGVSWIASGHTRNAALGNQYVPHYTEFGRVRDTNGALKY